MVNGDRVIVPSCRLMLLVSTTLKPNAAQISCCSTPTRYMRTCFTAHPHFPHKVLQSKIVDFLGGRGRILEFIINYTPGGVIIPIRSAPLRINHIGRSSGIYIRKVRVTFNGRENERWRFMWGVKKSQQTVEGRTGGNWGDLLVNSRALNFHARWQL